MKQEKWFIKNEMPTRAKKTTHWRRRRRRKKPERNGMKSFLGRNVLFFFLSFNGPMNKIFWRMPRFYVSIGGYTYINASSIGFTKPDWMPCHQSQFSRKSPRHSNISVMMMMRCFDLPHKAHPQHQQLTPPYIMRINTILNILQTAADDDNPHNKMPLIDLHKVPSINGNKSILLSKYNNHLKFKRFCRVKCHDFFQKKKNKM